MWGIGLWQKTEMRNFKPNGVSFRFGRPWGGGPFGGGERGKSSVLGGLKRGAARSDILSSPRGGCSRITVVHRFQEGGNETGRGGSREGPRRGGR